MFDNSSRSTLPIASRVSTIGCVKSNSVSTDDLDEMVVGVRKAVGIMLEHPLGHIHCQTVVCHL